MPTAAMCRSPHQTGKEFWVTQWYDTMPGHPGGEFNVDFYVEGSGFKYLGGAPYDGTIKQAMWSFEIS